MKKLSERSEWEKEWESAFDDASLPPSGNVWNGIDGALTKEEVHKYKKRAFFYQWVAAASVLLVLGLGGWLILTEPLSKNAAQLVQEEQPVQNVPAPESANIFEEAAPQLAATDKPATPKATDNDEPTVGKAVSRPVVKQENPQALAAVQNNEAKPSGASKEDFLIVPVSSISSASLAEVIVNNALSGFVGSGKQHKASIALVDGKGFMEDNFRPGELDASIQKVWVASQMLEEEEDTEDPKYWLGASLASNLYQPNFENGEYSTFESLTVKDVKPTKGNQISTARISEWKEDQEQEISINAGLQAATWLSKRWVLQGGLQYGSYRSSATAGTFVDGSSGEAYPLHYANFSYDKLQKASVGSRLAAPVSAINSFEFISVPLQIGYVVIDRQFGLMLSPGISSEFFLRNQISDEKDRLNTFTVLAGENAPFNTVHLKAILGAQLYYKLGDHYMISLEPSFQQAITNFSKSDSYFNSRPTNIGVAAGFRYIFR